MVQFLSEHLTISLSATEFEFARMPSFRAELEVCFSYRTGSQTFSSNSIWFGIKDWDELVDSLNADREECSISDFSCDVNFRLARKGIKNRVMISLRRRVAGVGNGELKLDFDDDSEFYEQFRQFAKSVKQRYVNARSC